MVPANSKILVLVESLDVNDSSGTKGRVALIQSFVKAGYEVDALHYTQKKMPLEGITTISVPETKFSLAYVMSRIQRLLYRLFRINIGNNVDKIYGFSYGFMNDVKSLAKGLNKLDPSAYDMIWALSKGNSYRAHAAVLKSPQWHNKWFAYVHDPYPQQLYPRPFNYVPHGYKKKRMFMRDVTLKAHRMVFPSLLLKEWLQSYYVALEGKSLVIPHQASNQPIKTTNSPAYFDSSQFSLLHAGNLLDLRDPKPIVEAFESFLKKYPKAQENARLLFLGKPSKFSEYLANKSEKITQLYASEDYVPFGEVYTMQQLTSVNIILEAKSETSPFLPGKFTHSVSANSPILLVGPHYSECKRLLGDAYPYSFEFDEIDAITEAIASLYEKWSVQNGKLELNRPDLVQYLSSDALKNTLENDNTL